MCLYWFVSCSHLHNVVAVHFTVMDYFFVYTGDPKGLQNHDSVGQGHLQKCAVCSSGWQWEKVQTSDLFNTSIQFKCLCGLWVRLRKLKQSRRGHCRGGVVVVGCIALVATVCQCCFLWKHVKSVGTLRDREGGVNIDRCGRGGGGCSEEWVRGQLDVSVLCCWLLW